MTARYTVSEFLWTYGSWQSLMQRCVYNGRRKDHALYRGRGIKVCVRWKKFENFIEDMGPRTDRALSLDRFPDKNGNYKPGNCRWATAREQAANTRQAILLAFRGQKLPVSEWARRTGLSRATIQFRLRSGWPLARALTAAAGSADHAHTSFAAGRSRGKKLSRADVRSLVRLARTGQWTAVALGRKYAVSDAAVCHIAKQFGVQFKKGRPRCSTK